MQRQMDEPNETKAVGKRNDQGKKAKVELALSSGVE